MSVIVLYHSLDLDVSMFANHRTHQRVNVGEAYALVESRSGDFIGEGDAGLARIGEGAAAAAAAAAAVPTSPIVKSPHQHRNLGAGIVDARPVPTFAFNRSLASPQTRTSSLSKPRSLLWSTTRQRSCWPQGKFSIYTRTNRLPAGLRVLQQNATMKFSRRM